MKRTDPWKHSEAFREARAVLDGESEPWRVRSSPRTRGLSWKPLVVGTALVGGLSWAALRDPVLPSAPPFVPPARQPSPTRQVRFRAAPSEPAPPPVRAPRRAGPAVQPSKPAETATAARPAPLSSPAATSPIVEPAPPAGARRLHEAYTPRLTTEAERALER